MLIGFAHLRVYRRIRWLCDFVSASRKAFMLRLGVA